MNELMRLVIKREYSIRCIAYVKQVVYLIPVLALVLMFSSAQNAQYINQKVFLNNSDYQSIAVTDNNQGIDNTFEIYDCDMSIVEDIRGVLVHDRDYSCEIYNVIDTGYDFEKTYFSSDNMRGISPSELKSDEIIISYDVAKALKVRIGDTVSMTSLGEDSFFEFKVKSIMKTKYAYGDIGYKGTAIVNADSKVLSMICKPRFCTFHSDASGNIYKEEEEKECNMLLLPGLSSIIVNVVFPLLGAILIMLLISREIKNMIEKEKYNLAIMVSLGLTQKQVGRIIMALEGIVIIISSLGAMLIYKYGLMQMFIGDYVPIRMFMMYLVLLMVVMFGITWITVGRLKDRLSNDALLQTLMAKGELNV